MIFMKYTYCLAIKEGGDTVDLLIVTEKSDNASTFAKTRDDASTLSAFTEMRGNA